MFTNDNRHNTYVVGSFVAAVLPFLSKPIEAFLTAPFSSSPLTCPLPPFARSQKLARSSHRRNLPSRHQGTFSNLSSSLAKTAHHSISHKTTRNHRHFRRIGRTAPSSSNSVEEAVNKLEVNNPDNLALPHPDTLSLVRYSGNLCPPPPVTFPKIVGPRATTSLPTHNRPDPSNKLPKTSNLILVVGSQKNSSSNFDRLVEVPSPPNAVQAT